MYNPSKGKVMKRNWRREPEGRASRGISEVSVLMMGLGEVLVRNARRKVAVVDAKLR